MILPTEVRISDDYGFSRLRLLYRLTASRYEQPWKEFKAINIPIPIVPPIIAEIGGSLEGFASFGPGQLKDLEVDVTYNPEREEDTLIHGSAMFFVPADVGLRLAPEQRHHPLQSRQPGRGGRLGADG